MLRPFLSLPILSTTLLALAAPFTGRSEQVHSPVVGFRQFDCPAGSDTLLSVPFHPTPRWSGRLASAPTSPQAGVMRLNLANPSVFVGGELLNHPHFVQLRDDSVSEGRHFRVVAHGGNFVEVMADSADLVGLTGDSRVSLLPAWTLESLFPPATQTTFHPSSGNLASTRASELLLFDQTTAGTNLAPTRIFFVTDSQWIEAGSFEEAGAEVIEPGQAFLVRHSAGAEATTFLASQQVYGGAVTVALRVSAGSARDTLIALPRPVPTTLDELNPGPTVFEESPTTAPEDRRDQLLVYNNAEAARNKQPSAVYFRTNHQWVHDSEGFPPSGSVVLEPSTGLLLRKAAGSSDGIVPWVQEPNYDVTAP